MSTKEAVLQVVEQALEVEGSGRSGESFLSGIDHLIGSVEGPVDLVSNPKHLKGFGR